MNKTQKVFFLVFSFFLSCFLVGNCAKAALDSGFFINPVTADTDDLIGATANWQFTATTSQELVRGDVVQFIFPDVGLGAVPFLLTNTTATSFSGATDLYRAIGDDLSNLLVNPSFENATSSWDLTNGGTSDAAASATVPSVGGSNAEQITIDSSGSNALLYQTVDTVAGENYSLSFYARGGSGNETARVALVQGGPSSGCAEDEPYTYNFLTKQWACTSLAALFAPGSAYAFDNSLTSSYQRFSTSTIVATSSMGLYFGGGGDASFANEVILFDAIQLEEGDTVADFNLGGTEPDIWGISTSTVGSTMIYGFVSSTIPAGSSFSATVQGIKNPIGSLTAFESLVWQLKAGTPLDGNEPWGDLSTTKTSTTSLSLSLGRSGEEIIIEEDSGVTASSYDVGDTNVDYTFVFTASSSIPEGGKIFLNFPSGFDLSGATVSIADNFSINGDTPVEAGSNVLTDSGVESWTGDTPDNYLVLISGGSPTVADEDFQINGGSHAAKLTMVEGAPIYLGQKKTGLASGVSYRFSVWARNGGSGSMQFIFFNDVFASATQVWNFTNSSWDDCGGAGSCSPGADSIMINDLTTNYTQYCSELIVPTNGQLAFYVGNNYIDAEGTSATIYLDDLTLYTPEVAVPEIANDALEVVTSYSRNQIVLTTNNSDTSAEDTLTVVVGGVTNSSSAGEYDDFYVFTAGENDGLLDGSPVGFSDEIGYTSWPAGFKATLVSGTPAGVTLSQSSRSVTEDDGTTTYTIVLDSAPSANVVVTLAEDSPDFSVSPSTLTFTSANWDTPQTVTITAVADTLVENTKVSAITHSAVSSDSNYNGLTIGSVEVAIYDNDVSSGGGSGGGGIGSIIIVPTNPYLTINNQATSTTSGLVSLSLSVSGASEMIISEDANFSGSAWETFISNRSWTLSSATGTKTIYARYRNSYGGLSNIVSDSIEFLGSTTPVVAEPSLSVVAQPTVEPVVVPVVSAPETIVVVNNPQSAVIIKDINKISLQPASSLKFTYSYSNETEQNIRIRVVRQTLNYKNTVIASVQAYRTIKSGETFSFDASQLIGRYWSPGEYTSRVRIYNLTGKLLEENSFNFVVEAYKYKYLTKGILGGEDIISFDSSVWEKNKFENKLPATLRIRYSYINQTESKQDIKMVREFVDPAGKILSSRTGRWIMTVGEKDSLMVAQSLISNLEPGQYTIRVKALDRQTGELLAENSLTFGVELR